VADRLVYNGCNSWAGGGSCGIFTVGSWGTKRVSNGETPTKLVDGSSAFPTDTKAGLVAFQSSESGNWEAYVMAENGSGIRNISDSPNSSDGLPTISPDGQWVAFASDREGPWAVFVAPINGGPAQKLFDFPRPNPWGAGGDRDWTTERLSWGQ
jgi:Tol biopolymer transport system component